MIATEANWKDIQKYYSGTYILCPEYARDAALYVENAGPSGIKVSESNGDKGFIEVPYELTNPLVNRRQYFQWEDTAYYISRIPARMWKKGISSENTIIQRIQSNGALTGPQITGTLVDAFFKYNNKFPHKISEEALEGVSAQALAPHWLLLLGAANTLFLLDCPVAKVSHKNKLVTMLKEFSKVPLPVALQDWKVNYV